MRQTRRWIGLSILGFFLVTGVAAAQTAPPSTPTSTAGAFDRLSPGNQKIAQALFEAQKPSTSSGTVPLTRNQIAAMKQSGQGWGEVFKQMKAQGLIQDKNLGQVVSTFNHRHETSLTSATRHHRASSTSSGTSITTGSGRPRVVGGKAKTEGSASSGKGFPDERGREGASVAGGSTHGNAFGREDAGFSGGSGHGGGRGR